MSLSIQTDWHPSILCSGRPWQRFTEGPDQSRYNTSVYWLGRTYSRFPSTRRERPSFKWRRVPRYIDPRSVHQDRQHEETLRNKAKWTLWNVLCPMALPLPTCQVRNKWVQTAVWVAAKRGKSSGTPVWENHDCRHLRIGPEVPDASKWRNRQTQGRPSKSCQASWQPSGSHSEDKDTPLWTMEPAWRCPARPNSRHHRTVWRCQDASISFFNTHQWVR